MANKLYEESNIQAIANAIRAKGQTGTMTVAQMPSKIEAIQTDPTAADLSLNFNNAKIEQFIASVTYPATYTSSSVSSYTSGSNSGAPTGASTTTKAGTLSVYDNGGKCSKAVSAGSNAIYNVAPNHTGRFSVISNGKIVNGGDVSASGNLRVIKFDGIVNVRDLGGWTCDGGKVHYGKLFRSPDITNITAADKDIIENLLCVRAEVDFRESGTEGGGTTPLSNKVTYLHQPIGNYADALSTAAYKAKTKTALEFIMNNVVQGKPCLYHCAAGADRTGTVSWLLLGVLGVSQSNCDKEYEITSFAGPTRLRTTYLGALYNAVNALDGDDFMNKCKQALLNCGISINLINHFRHAMIDGNPIDLVEPEPFVPKSEAVANLKACTRMSWSSSTTSTKKPNNDNTYIALATTSGTLWPFTDRENNACFVIPVPNWATKVTVTKTDTAVTGFKFRSYKSDGTAVGAADDSNTSGVYTQLAGADVIQITAKYGSTSSPWNYDSKKFTVTFTNY